jgi:hypothetical protein
MLEGLQRYAPENRANEMIAAAASWAIYGAANEWAQKAKRSPSEEIAETVAALVAPMLQFDPRLIKNSAVEEKNDLSIR